MAKSSSRLDPANAKAQIYGSGDNKISWISYKDVAKFAVASLDNSEARNAVIELGGPEALSPLEVVQIFEEALREQRESASDPLQQSFAGLMLYYSRGNTVDMQKTLQKFPMQLTFIKDYAQASL